MSLLSDESLQKLKTIKDGLRKDFQSKLSTFRDISAYINPAMEDNGETAPIQASNAPDTGKFRYDNTAQTASCLSADGIEGTAFGRQAPWFTLALEDQDPKQKSNQRYLQTIEKQQYKQLNRSSFYDEGRLFVRSLLDFGTAIMMRTENVEAEMPVYRTLNIYRSLIAENKVGDVDVLIRDFFLSPQDAAEEYGLENLPETIQEQHRANKTDRSAYSEYIYPNGRYDIDIEREGKAYISIHTSESDGPKALRIDGYESRPFFASRYTRSYDGGAWGEDSPGLLQLSNIKELNAAVRDRRKVSQRIANPPKKATEGMYGRIKDTPGGTTYVPTGNDYTIMDTKADLSALDQDIVDWRNAITTAYHTEFFLILTQNMDKQKTATEIAGLQGEKAAILSAFFSRLGYEFLEPLLEDLYSIEVANGRIPPAPASLQGQPVKIDYISPLYRMQRQYLRMNSTKQAMNEIFALATVQVNMGQQPTALDKLDIDSAVQNIVDVYNMNEDLVRTQMQVDKIRIGRMKAQQAAQQAAQQEQQATMVNDRMKASAAGAKKSE